MGREFPRAKMPGRLDHKISEGSFPILIGCQQGDIQHLDIASGFEG